MRPYLSYLRYLLRHKWFVFCAGLRTRPPLWRLIVHDWSKFGPTEWGAYVKTFYGPFQIGEEVDIHSPEGVHGPARIIERRASSDGRFMVQMLSGSPPPFWAWDYEIDGLCDVLEDFDRAWLHHQHLNPHHWQHWILREDGGGTKVLRMPEHFVREMVADWAGAGRAITGRWDLGSWYAANRHKIELHPDTRRIVETLIPLVAPP